MINKYVLIIIIASVLTLIFLFFAGSQAPQQYVQISPNNNGCLSIVNLTFCPSGYNMMDGIQNGCPLKVCATTNQAPDTFGDGISDWFESTLSNSGFDSDGLT